MRSLECIDFVSCVSGNFEKRNHFQNNPMAGKFWRENFGGKILAGKFIYVWKAMMDLAVNTCSYASLVLEEFDHPL
jgi:hypothetical protein